MRINRGKIEKLLCEGKSKTELLQEAIIYKDMYDEDETLDLLEQLSVEEILNYRSTGGSYLHIAANALRENLVKIFIEKGLDVNLEAGMLLGGNVLKGALFMVAGRNPNPEHARAVIKLLLEAGADVNIPVICIGGQKGSTLMEQITKAAPIEDEEIVRMIKQHVDELNN